MRNESAHRDTLTHMERDDTFLEDVTATTRRLVLQEFTADSCIATTRILIDVLHYYGIEAKPIPVELIIFNNEAQQILETEGIQAVAAAVQAKEHEDLGGPWTVGLGVTVNNSPQGGHVVTGIPSRQLIIDGSLDQAARPHKHIHLKPELLQTTPEFLTTPGEITASSIIEDNKPPTLLVYTHSIHKQYLKSPNWRRQTTGLRTTVFKEITAQTIKELNVRH